MRLSGLGFRREGLNPGYLVTPVIQWREIEELSASPALLGGLNVMWLLSNVMFINYDM